MVQPGDFERWHADASATPGLSAVEHLVLSAIADHWRRRQADGWAPPVTYAVLDRITGAVPVEIGRAIGRLISLGLIAVQPGSGSRASHYMLAVPTSRDMAPSF